MDKFSKCIGLSVQDDSIWSLLEVSPRPMDLTNHEADEGYGSMIYQDSGLELIFGKSDCGPVLNTIWIFHESAFENISTYSGDMPKDIEFGLSTKEVEDLLGKPFKEGGGTSHALFGVIPKWMKYNFPNEYSLNISFNDQGVMKCCIGRPLDN